MKHIVSLFSLGLSVLAAHPASAWDSKVPTTVAEAREQIDPELLHGIGKRPLYKHPAGNVRAEDFHALFGNTVVVVDTGPADPRYRKKGEPDNALKIIWIGADYRYIWCKRDGIQVGLADDGGSEWPWAATKVKAKQGLTPLFDNAVGKRGWGHSPLYDGATGEIIFFGIWKRKWLAWNVGHLQKNLPAVTWTLCPDFPSAAELGTGVNEKQTAITYPDLMAQDRGQRILRPDLITPNPVEPYE